MGGKSTLLCQVCLAVILAQVGADVPAESFKKSPVDRIFVRMGAKDHIMAGQSTFLTELLETCSMLVGFEVYLKSIINTMEIVAKARVKSLDPDELVGGEELGPNWCEAHVLVAIKKRERLVRPYGLFVTIEDAIGATIAWPCPFISNPNQKPSWNTELP